MAANSTDSHLNKTPFLSSSVCILIAVNVGIALLGLISTVAGRITDGSPEAFRTLASLPANIYRVAGQPWSMVTYMFYHASLTHLLANISVLLLTAVASARLNISHQLLKAYLWGGIGGALAFLVFSNLIAPQLAVSTLSGASASVLGLSSYILVSQRHERIPFFGNRTLPFSLLPAAIIIPAMLLTPDIAAGASAAHIGGICAGIIFALLYGRNTAGSHDYSILTTDSNKTAS